MLHSMLLCVCSSSAKTAFFAGIQPTVYRPHNASLTLLRASR